MAIKAVIPITLEFENVDGKKDKVFKLKVLKMTKKKQKELKKFGEQLDEEYSDLNDSSKKMAKLEKAQREASENFEDASALAEVEPTKETILAKLEARKSLRKATKALNKARKDEIESEDNGAENEIDEKIFRKQLEIMLVESADLLAYMDEKGHSSVTVINEIFRLLAPAKKNSTKR